MAVFKQRTVDSTTIQTNRVCVPKRGKIEGYNVARLLDINGNVIGKALMDFDADAPSYRKYRQYC